MPFSFQNPGFWSMASIAFAFEFLHLLLQNYWPALHTPDSGPAKYFLLFEALVVLATLAAGVGEVQRLIKTYPRSLVKIALTTAALPILLLVLILVWNR